MGCDEQYAGAILLIWELIEKHRGTLVFTNTRSVAEDMAFRLRLLLGDPPVSVHHGSLSRESRERAEQDFKEGRLKALICTSSLELGIDIGTADLVLQFNSPRQINKLVQRVGRSGHWITRVSKGYVVCSDVVELEEAAAIIGYAFTGHTEDIRIMENSMATLANQLISEIRVLGRDHWTHLFSLFRRAYPFRNMTEEQFLDVVKFLSSTGKLRFDGESVSRGGRGGNLTYFIENISMIPSEKNYRVIDIGSNRFVGTLDERYVVSEIEPGTYFVMRGETWRTVRVDEDRILVERFPHRRACTQVVRGGRHTCAP